MLPWHTTGIYDHPQNFGLTILAETSIEPVPFAGICAGGFDIIVIWKRNEDGRILIGNDAGCGCPVPFENTSVDQLSVITTPDEIRYFVWDCWQTTDDESVDANIDELLAGVTFD